METNQHLQIQNNEVCKRICVTCGTVECCEDMRKGSDLYELYKDLIMGTDSNGQRKTFYDAYCLPGILKTRLCGDCYNVYKNVPYDDIIERKEYDEWVKTQVNGEDLE